MTQKGIPASALVAAVRRVTGTSKRRQRLLDVLDYDPIDMTMDPRPRRHGWVPGKYICRCHDCKDRFIGDKRAVLCAPCAYMRPDR